MADVPRQDVVVDTSTLINLLAADLLGVLARYPGYRLVITEHVRGEITTDYPEEQEKMKVAISAGHVVETRVESDQELAAFVVLVQTGQLGVGECAAIAAAACRSCAIAIDDRAARKVTGKLFSNVVLLDTEAIMVSLIRQSLVSLERADQIKALWETHHRFRLPFKSFRERI